MIYVVTIQVIALVFLLLLIFVRVYRKSVKSLSDDVFNVGLALAIFSVITDILQFVSLNELSHNTVFCEILIHINLSFAIIYTFFLLVYSFSVNNKKGYSSLLEALKKSTRLQIGLALTLLACVGLFFLPVTIITDSKTGLEFQYGYSLLYDFAVVSVYSVVQFIYLLINPNKIDKIKLVPLYTYEILGLIAVTIQWLNPSVLLISDVMAFIELFIYFTIENLNETNQVLDESIDKSQREKSSYRANYLESMSHDIRVPLNVIVGFSESLLMEPLHAKQREEVKYIYNASIELTNIMNNIVDISEIESGKAELNNREYDLRKVLNNITSIVSGKIDSSLVEYDVQINSNIPNVLYGDSGKVNQILLSVISNSVKFTTEGSIIIQASSTNDGDKVNLRFVVKDTGAGIKEENLNKIFDKYYKEEETLYDDAGSGLGLSIAKSLITIMGGNINIASVYGQGTTVTIDIPQKLGKSLALINSDTNLLANGFDGSKYSILVVDDNDLNLKVEERLLQDYGFEIELCSSGEDAVEIVKSGRKFDLIFIDYVMTGMDGLDVLNKIKDLRNVKVIPPVIALTANTLSGAKEHYIGEGFTDYLAKPIDRDALTKLLNRIFSKK